MITVFISFLAIVLVFIGVVAYFHYSNSDQSESSQSYSQTNKNSEADYIFLFAGNTIDRDGKHFQWNYELNKYEEVSLSFTVSASEPIAVHTTQSDVILTVESQITDAVTTKPAKPKKKRGRKPTKKIKK